MKKVLIISNRLPYQISIDNQEINLTPSVGGLATGMKSVYKKYGGKWIGWPGILSDDIDIATEKNIEKALSKEMCVPVFLSSDEVENFYEGFSNKTIWPLFHYFMQYTNYDANQWDAYKKVNQRFANIILENVKDVDKIWIHDYHFLLLPNIIKKARPDITIGFFLHIPFPSYEVFRLLPWRNEIIEGMLGADLLGFHTYDYERHFLSCVRRLLGYDVMINQISLENRIIKADVFPMGIDYSRFHEAALKQAHLSVSDKTDMRKEIEKYLLASPGRKLVLSIDRLDYSKGIPNRLYAFEVFLEKYPQYHGKITLIMLAVPSRESVEQYRQMKSEVDELVGRINGAYATINWTPIWYFYRSMPFEDLIELYNASDIALITPIRDGMNLVAKEYIASRTNGKGVIILSEMAGAAKEMGEALIINPNNTNEIADAIKDAVEMPEELQKQRILNLQNRLMRYNVVKWAEDFMAALDLMGQSIETHYSKKLTTSIQSKLLSAFFKARKRIVFLDYDGTLVGFKNSPKAAMPDADLYKLLDALASIKNTEVVLISGRDKATFDEWFGGRNISLVTDHGVWINKKSSGWQLIDQLDSNWKDIIRPSIEFYVDRTPGTSIEEKNYSLVWHYRQADPELGHQRAIELKDELSSMVFNYNLEIMEGNKVIEIKNSGINKGRAANVLLMDNNYDFIMAIGDDWTDEFLFQGLPDNAYTIKVGYAKTQAKFNIDSVADVRFLLMRFLEK